MKKTISILMVLLLMSTVFSANAEKPKKSTASTLSKATKIEVYYFHFTRRCATCQAVETESQKAIIALYPDQYKSGKITFKSVNLSDKDSKVLAKKHQVDGQALLIICRNKRFDLTEQGFLYAKNNPDRLKQELKQVIDPLIK